MEIDNEKIESNKIECNNDKKSGSPISESIQNENLSPVLKSCSNCSADVCKCVNQLLLENKVMEDGEAEEDDEEEDDDEEELEEDEINEANTTIVNETERIASSENNSIKPLLSKNKAKQRLQAFSQTSPIKLKKSNTVVKAPKLVVSIETQYDENGEITEDTLVIRKPPKAGGNHQEKAKAVISEIEEIKKREIQYNLHNSMNHSSPILNLSSRKFSSYKSGRSTSKHSSSNRHSRKNGHRSREHTNSTKREHTKSKSYKSSRNDYKKIKSWSDVVKYFKGGDIFNRRYLNPKIPELRTVQFNMKTQLTSFEEKNILVRTHFNAKSAVNLNNFVFYYRQTVKRTLTPLPIFYCENSKSPTNLFPNRLETFAIVPKDRADIMKEFIKNCTNEETNNDVKKQCKEWFTKTFLNNIVVSSYGLSVLTKNYENHWDESDVDEKNKSPKIEQIVSDNNVHELNLNVAVADNNCLLEQQQQSHHSEVMELQMNEEEEELNKCNNDTEKSMDMMEIKTPDTDEYKSNWEIDEDDFDIEGKSTLFSENVWNSDEDDNSLLSRKVSKKFNRSRNKSKRKYDFCDISYNNKKEYLTNGLSDSFISSFGYRRSGSKSDKESDVSGKNYKNERNNKKDSDSRSSKRYRSEPKTCKERGSGGGGGDESRSSSKNKSTSFTDILENNNSTSNSRRQNKTKMDFNFLEDYEDVDKYFMNDLKTYYNNYSELKSNKNVNVNVNVRKTYWEYDEDEYKEYFQSKRERNWPDNKDSYWKDNDVNEFRLQEKMELDKADEIVNNEQNTTSTPDVKTNLPPETDVMVDDKSKLVSEYEEFMKTVGCDLVTDENPPPPPAAAAAQSQTTTVNNEEEQLKKEKRKVKKKVVKKSNKKNLSKKRKHSSSSSDDDDDDHANDRKRRQKRRKKKVPRKQKQIRHSSTDSSSSDSSSSTSSSSSSSSTSSSDSSSSTSSSSSSSTKSEKSVQSTKVKIEQLSDDENRKAEQVEQDEKLTDKVDGALNEVSNISSFSDSVPPTELSADPIKICNTGITLSLMPKAQPFSSLLSDKENTNANKVHTAKENDEEADVDFTDIILKRTRDKTTRSRSPDVKKHCRISLSPSRRLEKRKRSPERVSSRGSRRDRDDYRYRDDRYRRSRDHSRDRRRSDYSKYSPRRSYDSKKDRDRYRSDRRRSRSPIDRRESTKLKSSSHHHQQMFKNDREFHSNSPAESFNRSVPPDSTISDSELLSQSYSSATGSTVYDNSFTLKPPLPPIPPPPQQQQQQQQIAADILKTKTESPSVDSPLSPKRLSLDDRINQFLGIEPEKPSSNKRQQESIYSQHSYDDYMSQDYYDRYNYYEGYHHHQPPLPARGQAAPHYAVSNYYSNCTYPAGDIRAPPPPAGASKVVQVGNFLQVVPADLDTSSNQQFPIKEEQDHTKTKVVQVGNMLQIVPAAVLPQPDKVAPAPVSIEIKKELPAISAANKIEQEIGEELLKRKLEKEKRRIETEKRRAEREKRRKEREDKRLERQKRREARVKLKIEKMIKKALQKETENSAADISQLDLSELVANYEKNGNTDDDNNQVTAWPPPAPLPACLDPPAKGILVKSGFSKLKTDISGSPMVENAEESLLQIKKTVKFADGIHPGEGTSPSGGEDLPSPPPPKRKLPKEQRYKKTKLRTKKKVKVKVIRSTVQQPVEEDDDEDDNLPPPPPPPGSPPPHLWPRANENTQFVPPQPAAAAAAAPFPPQQHIPIHHHAFPPPSPGGQLPPLPPPPNYLSGPPPRPMAPSNYQPHGPPPLPPAATIYPPHPNDPSGSGGGVVVGHPPGAPHFNDHIRPPGLILPPFIPKFK